jgi:hypothetical protein
MVNNEDRLRAFLSSPYGVMTNNETEEKFRELDLLTELLQFKFLPQLA